MIPTKRNQEFIPGLSNNILFKDLINWPQQNSTKKEACFPAVNIIESAANFHLEIAVPGLKKEDFFIELDNESLNVSYTKNQDAVPEDHTYTRKEFYLKSFKRKFELPEGEVDKNNIKASYEQGILKVTLPKLQPKKEKVKQISVN